MAVAAVLIAMLGGMWLWFRDSQLVAVQRVAVTEDNGPEAAQIRSALVQTARTMTTLDVDMGRLRRAVSSFPVVKDLSVSTQFPHGMRIRVIEQIPVASVLVGGRPVAVAGDGTLLHDVVTPGALPQISLRIAPGGSRVSDPNARAAVAILAAAPVQMISRLSAVTITSAHGPVAQVRGGPSIYFGDVGRASEKWLAAIAVLGDPGSAGAAYIDVTDPGRPAAGG